MADPTPELSALPAPPPAGVAATLVLVRHGESTWVAEGRFQGRQDPPLSALGRRQSVLVAERLAQRDDRTPLPIPVGPPIAIWHSPLQRAAETARVIAERQPEPVDLRPIEALTEIAQGAWEGMPHADVTERWPDELAAWRRAPADHHAPGGESLPDAATRVRLGLANVVAALAGPAPGTDGRSALSGAAIRSLPSDRAGDPAAIRKPAVTGYQPVPGYPTAVPAHRAAEPWAILVAHDGIFRLVLLSLTGIALERFWSFPFNLAAITVVAVHEGVAALRAHNLSDHLAPLAADERAAQESRGERRGAL